mmetsp:Transcript_22228/g.42411  ORF Transcript_22228/g.42411 Transcript_22228/m.42411 type:complete len:263 (+) Transcript_22228:980-1768(+)
MEPVVFAISEILDTVFVIIRCDISECPLISHCRPARFRRCRNHQSISLFLPAHLDRTATHQKLKCRATVFEIENETIEISIPQCLERQTPNSVLYLPINICSSEALQPDLPFRVVYVDLEIVSNSRVPGGDLRVCIHVVHLLDRLDLEYFVHRILTELFPRVHHATASIECSLHPRSGKTAHHGQPKRNNSHPHHRCDGYTQSLANGVKTHMLPISCRLALFEHWLHTVHFHHPCFCDWQWEHEECCGCRSVALFGSMSSAS